MAKEIIRDDDGKPWSKWKPAAKFAFVWERDGFDGGDPDLEFRFHPSRRWRFDYAWPELMIAVEIDGFGFGHQSQQGIGGQNEKRNAAIELGWRVLVFDSRTLGSKQGVADAVEQVCRVLMIAAG